MGYEVPVPGLSRDTVTVTPFLLRTSRTSWRSRTMWAYAEAQRGPSCPVCGGRVLTSARHPSVDSSGR